MMPFDDAITFMQKAAQDNTATTLTFLKLMYNIGYQRILAQFGRQVIEVTRTLDLVAGTRGYTMWPDVLFPKTLEFVDGTTRYPLTEVASDKSWAYMKSGNMQGRPTHYHYQPKFGVGGGSVEFYPIPSSSTYDVDIIFESRDKDLSVLAYATGTIALTNNATSVVGTTTVFTAAMVGRYLIPTTAGSNELPYRIASYTDGTHITLESAYLGDTNSGLNYKIVEIPNLPQEMQILPAYFALEAFWSSRGNAQKQTEFSNKYIAGMSLAKKTHAVVTRDNIINPPSPALPFEPYPINYPTEIS